MIWPMEQYFVASIRLSKMLWLLHGRMLEFLEQGGDFVRIGLVQLRSACEIWYCFSSSVARITSPGDNGRRAF
ncbi:MAG: hypothetical protein MZV63_41500 [Marinilabiliales bacterium]|nr:hypothetical protein [Marinilabiliales bacterium]